MCPLADTARIRYAAQKPPNSHAACAIGVPVRPRASGARARTRVPRVVVVRRGRLAEGADGMVSGAAGHHFATSRAEIEISQ